MAHGITENRAKAKFLIDFKVALIAALDKTTLTRMSYQIR